MFSAQVLILMQTQRLMKSVNYVKLNYVYKFNNFPRWTLLELNSTSKNYISQWKSDQKKPHSPRNI